MSSSASPQIDEKHVPPSEASVSPVPAQVPVTSARRSRGVDETLETFEESERPPYYLTTPEIKLLGIAGVSVF